jgi:heat shock protein HslJ
MISLTAKLKNKAKKSNFKLSVRKILIVPLVLSIVAVLSGCNSSSEELVGQTSTDLVALQSAKTKWQSYSAQFYTIQSRRSCECLPEVSAQMEMSVSDNSVLSAFYLDSDELASTEIQEGLETVDSLFALIETAIADKVSIEVTYNEEYGYPETTKTDLEQLAVDGGLHIDLSNLEIKGSILALDNVIWMLESFDSIAGPQAVIAGSNITMSIDLQNMVLGGVGGCNAYGADLVLDEANNDVTLTNVISTDKACSEPENVMQQEQNYFATLEQVRFFNVDGATLNMVVGGDAGLHFVVGQYSDGQSQTGSSSYDLALLQAAKTKWDSHSAQFYTILSQRYCECTDEAAVHMQISVLDNSVLSAFSVNTEEVISTEIREEIQTVDNLFTLIETAITDNVSIEVTYNQEFGYPETVKIDLEEIQVDGGLHISLSNLEIKDSSFALGEVTWVLESFDSIAGPQPLIENTNITLSIDMDNQQLSGMGGCNSYRADFALDAENHDITISNIISTQQVCAAFENIMQQEARYFATLEQIWFFTFDAATLNMVVGGDAGLYFAAAD